MSTSQRVPRRALLRRVGPWVVLAAILTGCASPAARVAVSSLQEECHGDQASATLTCQALTMMAERPSTVAGPGPDVASIRTARAVSDTVFETRRTRERPKQTTRKASRPKAEATPKARRRSQPTPRRTARVPKVRMPAISAAYFGGGVSLARFRIIGDTRSQILRSIRTRGPHGGAVGVTQPSLKYRFTFKFDRKGRCRVVRTGSSAVSMSLRVTLPSWAATTGTDRATASWWAGQLRDTASHERRHVRLWRNAVRQANRVVATSSCSNVGRRLNAVWRKAAIANCRYDASEYGISMRACLRR